MTDACMTYGATPASMASGNATRSRLDTDRLTSGDRHRLDHHLVVGPRIEPLHRITQARDVGLIVQVYPRRILLDEANEFTVRLVTRVVVDGGARFVNQRVR